MRQAWGSVQQRDERAHERPALRAGEPPSGGSSGYRWPRAVVIEHRSFCPPGSGGAAYKTASSRRVLVPGRVSRGTGAAVQGVEVSRGGP